MARNLDHGSRSHGFRPCCGIYRNNSIEALTGLEGIMHRLWIGVALGVVAFNLIGRMIVQAIFKAAGINATA